VTTVDPIDVVGRLESDRSGGIAMLLVGMIVLGLATFYLMFKFVALCDKV
jgi:hypothetical protein